MKALGTPISRTGVALRWVVRAPWFFLAYSCAGGAAEPAPAVAPAELGVPLRFSLGIAGGQHLTSENTKGRATLILLLTTYDTASQLMALRVNELLHTFKPRINAAAVVMEPPKYELLTDTYRETLGLDYPVVLADAETLAGRGPFGQVDHIPTVIVLDRSGRRGAQISGPATFAQLEAELERVLQ